MKLLKIRILLTFILVGVVTLQAQDKRTLETKIADILTEMPSKDLAKLDGLLDQMIALDEAGLVQFMDQLKPSGSDDDDTRYRFALESLSRKLSKEKGGHSTKMYIAAIVKSFIKQNDVEVKNFLLRRLNAIADDGDVDFLLGLVESEEYRSAALSVIVSVGSDKAVEGLVSKIDKGSDWQYIEIVKALDDLESNAIVSKAIADLTNENSEIKKQVLMQYLSSIGDPTAYDALISQVASVNYMLDKLNSVNYLLDFAQNTDQATALKVAKEVMKNTKEDSQMGFRATALEISLKGISSSSSANKLLLNEFKSSENKQYRVAVLNYSLDYTEPGITESWGKMVKKSSPEKKAEILSMMNRRNDPKALNYIPSEIKDERVAAEAYLLLAKLKKEEAIPTILKGMKNNNFAEEGLAALKIIVGKENLKELAEMIPFLPPSSKIAAIELIAYRHGTDQFEVVETHLSDLNAHVRNASHKALKDVSNEDDLDELAKLIDLAPDHHEPEIAAAIVSALNYIEDPIERENKFLEILSNSKKQRDLIIISPQIGGAKVMDRVFSEFKRGAFKEEAFTAIKSWKDPMVAGTLFNIVSTAPSGSKVGKEAFDGYLNVAKLQSVTDDQRVLMLKKLMNYAKSTEQKNNVIKAAGNARTYLSFEFVSKYLDNKDLQNSASRALMNIALPKASENTGLEGPRVVSALEKSIEVMDGPESQYLKEDIRVYLRNMNKTRGYVAMFNGKDLTGWQGFVSNPIAKAKLSQRELDQKQKQADEEAKQNWSVHDGSIVFDGKGHNLVSVKEYGDFEMYCDWKITEGGDSGIYLRGTPQVQIWDTSRVEVGAQVGSGGLYNNQKNPRIPLEVADNPINEWNTFYIKMIGEKVWVKLNGKLIVDNVTLENYWDRKMPIFSSGPIELQAHGSNLEFRDIYIKELSSPDFSVTPEEKEAGFVSLFNGKDLTSWIGNKTDYYAENGVIMLDPKKGGRGNLFTEKEYTNFIYRFEFQLTPGANNGLGIHAPLQGDAAYAGKELQILDNTASIYANLKEYQYHGSIYGVVAAKRGFLRPVGEWNEQEVIVDGDRIKITLNGEVIVDADYVAASKNGTADGRDHPGLKKKTGYIGFLGHGSELKFRNIRIKTL